MEKLMKLLNEHRAELLNGNIQNKPMRYSYGSYVFGLSDLTEQNCILLIISKSYGFIKWLVDNDKIDRLTFCTVETPSSKYEDFDLGPETPREDYTNILLMDLAIQEEPIEFLISILK